MYDFVTEFILVIYRQKKIEISQGLRLCCKRFCNYMLLEFSLNVVMQRKVLLYTEFSCCITKILLDMEVLTRSLSFIL